ncbi:MAG TPA: sulfur carrier protein ThiS [Candidatus Acidoferrales bacterium]|nr:sulfur carrier protein ThiS [Candidatus Acidoferrales bacterium]
MSSTTNAAINVTINGEAREVPSGLTVAALLGHLGIGERVAIERNRDILARAQWQGTAVCAGDNYEIVHFVGGG